MYVVYRNEWNQLGNLSKQSAHIQYIEQLTKYIPNWMEQIEQQNQTNNNEQAQNQGGGHLSFIAPVSTMAGAEKQE
jgi:hypothetical protein